jgi:predicted Ser/Thr protein kinase/tetratricopeptide (TPR) repeat protein
MRRIVTAVPERIGKYRVLEPLGRGGMGVVYKAHDPVLDRQVAVKVMTEGAEVGTEARERFLREAQSAARLNHPNIITVYELGEDAGQIFIVMELLEGDPLSRVITREPPLPLRQKLGIMLQICEGLGFAHQRGIVHRDIKPANIFVLANGQVKILDFGIARLSSSDLTRTGLLMGTPSYMSPEQARGRRTDHRSDIFSVGVVFYELLAGRKPFMGEDYFETLEKVRSEEPPPLGEMVPDLPPPLVRSIYRTLAKDPSTRYQALDEVRADLAAVPDPLPTETIADDLREAVDRQFAEMARLHRGLATALGAAALGDETLPLADPAAAGAGLDTILRDLERRTDRLRALALTVERQEPAIAQGIALFERGAFEDAAATLQAVLKEIPQHQRARDYYDRTRLELLRERTVRPATVGRTPTRPSPGAAPRSVTPMPSRETEAATAVATPPGRPVSGVVVTPPSPPTMTEMTRGGGGRRFGLVLAGVVALATIGGGLVLFRSPAPTPARAPSVTPAPAPPAPAPAPVVTPPPVLVKPTQPMTSTPAGAAPGQPAPAPGRPAPSPGTAAAPRPTAGPAPATPAAAAKPPAAAAKPPAAAPASGSGVPVAALTPEQAKDVRDAIEFAQVFQARGDHARAVREYQRALAIDPRNAEAKQGMVEAEAAMKTKP